MNQVHTYKGMAIMCFCNAIIATGGHQITAPQQLAAGILMVGLMLMALHEN